MKLNVIPHKSTGVLPGIHAARHAQQAVYRDAVLKALRGDDGQDLVAEQIGLIVTGKASAHGAQDMVLSVPGDNAKGRLSDDASNKLDVYAAAMGYVLNQEGVGYQRPFYQGSKASHNAVEFRIGRSLSLYEIAAFGAKVEGIWSRLGGAPDAFGVIPSPEGVRVVSFDDSVPNKAFIDSVKSAGSEIDSNNIDYGSFATDGNLVENNWKEYPNGQDYERALTAAGRSDLYGWGRSVLAARVEAVNREFATEYGWGTPTVLRSRPSGEDAGRFEGGRGRRRSRDGRVSDGEHVQPAGGNDRASSGREARNARAGDEDIPAALDQRSVLASGKRHLTVEDKYRASSDFFSAVVQGIAHQPKPDVEYEPVISEFIARINEGDQAETERDDEESGVTPSANKVVVGESVFGEVKITFSAIIVLVRSIEEKVDGGLSAFAERLPSERTGALYALSAMSGGDLDLLCSEIEDLGLDCGRDYALGEMWHGEVAPCLGIRFITCSSQFPPLVLAIPYDEDLDTESAEAAEQRLLEENVRAYYDNNDQTEET